MDLFTRGDGDTKEKVLRHINSKGDFSERILVQPTDKTPVSGDVGGVNRITQLLWSFLKSISGTGSFIDLFLVHFPQSFRSLPLSPNLTRRIITTTMEMYRWDPHVHLDTFRDFSFGPVRILIKLIMSNAMNLQKFTSKTKK